MICDDRAPRLSATFHSGNTNNFFMSRSSLLPSDKTPLQRPELPKCLDPAGCGTSTVMVPVSHLIGVKGLGDFSRIAPEISLNESKHGALGPDRILYGSGLALNPGARLGPYEILSSLGAGGMGQVYRARDTKLDRDVAIKFLPEAFAHDADRLARFQREAKTLASLNHPNIAGIYGLEESEGMTALVMELVEGEDLSQRIARGRDPNRRSACRSRDRSQKPLKQRTTRGSSTAT